MLTLFDNIKGSTFKRSEVQGWGFRDDQLLTPGKAAILKRWEDLKSVIF
jgi:hypothetical protein